MLLPHMASRRTWRAIGIFIWCDVYVIFLFKNDRWNSCNRYVSNYKRFHFGLLTINFYTKVAGLVLLGLHFHHCYATAVTMWRSYLECQVAPALPGLIWPPKAFRKIQQPLLALQVKIYWIENGSGMMDSSKLSKPAGSTLLVPWLKPLRKPP